MKKIFYAASFLAIASLAVFTGCKKVDEGPFPAKPQSNGVYNDFAYITPSFPNIPDASGILISAQVHDRKIVIISSFQNQYEYGMAQFSNTAGNFTNGNLIDVGAITLNDTNLKESSSFSYLSTTSINSLNLAGKTSWKLQGNGSLPGFNYTLNGIYPTYSDSFQNWADTWLPSLPIKNVAGNDSLPYDIDTLFQIPIKKYTSNADSVFIVFTSNGVQATKQVKATDSLAIFTRTDFRSFSTYGYDPTQPLVLQINPIKYQDTAIGAKNYYFLKMGSYIKYYQATK